MSTFLDEALSVTGMRAMSDFGDDAVPMITVDAPSASPIAATTADEVQLQVSATETQASLLSLANSVCSNPSSAAITNFQQAYNVAANAGQLPSAAAGGVIPVSGKMDQYTTTAMAALEPTAGISGESFLGNYYAPPTPAVRAAAAALDASPAKSPDLVAAFQSAFNAAGGRPQLSLDGDLGPATIAALASYVSGDQLQAYFSALGSADVVTSLSDTGDSGSGFTAQSAVGGESDKHGFDYVPNALEYGRTRDPIGSNARRWWRGWGRPVEFGADGVTPVAAGPATAPAGMLASAAQLLQTAGPGASKMLVEAFQKAYNASLPAGSPAIGVDGILGPQTRAALQSALGSQLPALGASAGATLAKPSLPVMQASGGVTAPVAVPGGVPTDWLPAGGFALMGLGAAVGAFLGWFFSGTGSRTTSPGLGPTAGGPAAGGPAAGGPAAGPATRRR